MLKLSLIPKNLNLPGDVWVLPFLDKKLYSHALIDGINQKLAGELEKVLRRLEFKGEVGESVSLTTHGKLGCEVVVALGLGETKRLSLETLRRASAATVKTALAHKAKHVLSFLPLIFPQLAADAQMDLSNMAQAVAEGAYLSLYRFARYKSKPEPRRSLQEISFLQEDKAQTRSFKQAFVKAQVISDATLMARDLVNLPSRDKPPLFLAKTAKKIQGVTTKIVDHHQMKKIGMGALYAVGMGSPESPVLVEMHYKPQGKIKKTIALVGKGITFDSGGLSLKPPKSMETMKDDMAGAAAVLGVMQALTQLKPAVEVYGYIAAAENMPDGAAQRPGDVVTAYNGKTIEVLNTDAEGRLALADALSYLGKHRKVDHIIDLATLTGAALVALGDLYTAAMTTDPQLLARLQKSADLCGEKLWELPLEEKYWEEFKSDIADMKNIGGPYAGSIQGGLFLKQFIPENASWVHLDIAGPAWAYKPWPYSTPGGTGIMVRTLLHFLLSYA